MEKEGVSHLNIMGGTHATASREFLLPNAFNAKHTKMLKDAVNIPVVAAGGIADGRGFAAAFMLGASGVQMGTSFVATKESTVHDNYKAKIVKAKDIDTKVTGRSTGHPVRNLRNKQTNTYLKLEAEGAGHGTA